MNSKPQLPQASKALAQQAPFAEQEASQETFDNTMPTKSLQDPSWHKAPLKRTPSLPWPARVLRRLLPAPIWKQLRNFATLSATYGQFASMKQWSCLNGEGEAIPWYTYPTIEYLSHLDFTSRKILEYGSGNSSLWWASRCKSLISIESSAEWHEKISSAAKAAGNIDYRLALEKDSYVRQEDIAEANVVIIDGIYRPECVDFLVEKIRTQRCKPDLVIFDNSDWYPKTLHRLHSQLTDWIRVDFSGFGPINEYTWTTSIFLNPAPGARLSHASSLASTGGLAQIADDDR